MPPPSRCQAERLTAAPTSMHWAACCLRCSPGRLPFADVPGLTKVAAHIDRKPPTLAQRGLSAPDALEAALARALAKPGRRALRPRR
jgi:hypothetical protein